VFTIFPLPGWLAEDSLPELVGLLCTVETITKWYHLGLQLRIPSSTLLRIEEDYQKTQDRFTRMLEEWLYRTRNPTKRDLVAALRSEVLQENRLADQMERWIPLSSPWQGEYGSCINKTCSVIVYYYIKFSCPRAAWYFCK